MGPAGKSRIRDSLFQKNASFRIHDFESAREAGRSRSRLGPMGKA
jgi:hypothetical protein